MEKTRVKVQPSFYTNSPYAKSVIKDLKNDSYGLVFNEFLHEIGSMLEVDIVYDQVNQTKWKHADTKDVQVYLNKVDNQEEEFEFISKSTNGEKLISNMVKQLKKENSDYMGFE